MLGNLQLGAPQLLAAGLTLVVAWLVLLMRSSLRRIATLLLQSRAPVWIDRITILLQAILLVSALFFLVRWLGTDTSVAVVTVVLLWLVVVSVRHSTMSNAGVVAIRARLLSTAAKATVVAAAPVQSPASRAITTPASQLRPLTPVGEAAAPLVNAETVSASTALVPGSAAAPAGATDALLLANVPPAPGMTGSWPQLQKPVTLTRRPLLGKKTTAGLL